MRALRQGDSGVEVRRWQTFLAGQGFEVGVIDGKFGNRTFLATIAFQQRHGLVPDGIVANRTLGQAGVMGFPIVTDTTSDREGPNFPPRPNFAPVTSTRDRQALFGTFRFEARPVPGNRENIRILDDWPARNIVTVTIPQLRGIPGAGTGRVEFHRKAAPQLEKVWAAWDQAGLLDRVLTWHGSFVPRFVRGSTKTLSNHAFGSAFDINANFNPLGAMPALVGKRGAVRELVAIAHRHGFFWGGHFTRLDGMHFEIAKLQ